MIPTVLIAKKLIKNENISRNQITLCCMNNPTKDHFGRVFHCRLKDSKQDVNDIIMKDMI